MLSQKTFVCHRCGRDFARLEHLQRHERSHTKEKPYHCVLCTRAFTRKDLLTRHVRLHHGERKEIIRASVEIAEPESITVIKGSTVDSVWVGTTTPSALTVPGLEPPDSPNDSSALSLGHKQRFDNFNLGRDAFPAQFNFQLTEGATDGESGSNFPGPAIHFPPDMHLRQEIPNACGPDFADDFSEFMDTVPNLSYTFSPTYQPLPVLFGSIDSPLTFQSSTDTRPGFGNVGQRETVPTLAPLLSSTEDSLLSRYESRLPSLQPEDEQERLVASDNHLTLNNRHFLITAEYRQQLVDHLTTCFGKCINKDVTLPSRHALARYIGSYFKNYHDHYPFFHVPTLQLEGMNVELFLSIAAMGARYTREQDAGLDLYNLAKSVALERLHRHRTPCLSKTSEPCLHSAPISSEAADSQTTPFDLVPESSDTRDSQILSLSQTLILLIAIATWYKKEPAAAEALSLRSILHSLTQEEGLDVEQVAPDDDWHSWSRSETMKRTRLVIFCFFNIHTIIFDLPPMMLATELKLNLPCSEAEWRATDEQEWHKIRRTGLPGAPQYSFQDALANLFADAGDSCRPSPNGMISFSALAGCALIHAIIQKTWLVRSSRMPSTHHRWQSFSDEHIGTFERALNRWARSWERNQESSMDPLSPDGPVTFTSTALLRLAYIRLHMDLGPVRSLGSWDPQIVAQSLHRSPAVQRSDKLARAALHCAHALSIPVKLGINYVAQTQLIHWSNQHALCSLECAVLLAKWLQQVTSAEPSPPLDTSEHKVLDFVVELVAEAGYKVSCEKILRERSRLSAKTVKLWARLYQSNSVWETVNLIGQSLSIYAELLEAGTL